MLPFPSEPFPKSISPDTLPEVEPRTVGRKLEHRWHQSILLSRSLKSAAWLTSSLLHSSQSLVLDYPIQNTLYDCNVSCFSCPSPTRLSCTLPSRLSWTILYAVLYAEGDAGLRCLSNSFQPSSVSRSIPKGLQQVPSHVCLAGVGACMSR